MDNSHEVINTATSGQHSFASASSFTVIDNTVIDNILRDHPQQILTLPCSTQLPQSKADSNVFSRYGTVEKTLQNHVQGASILKGARKGSFNESDRRALVRIVIAELIATQNDNHYPPDEAKISLANAIVSEFPLLKNNVAGCKGYEHYYDPKGAFRLSAHAL